LDWRSRVTQVPSWTGGVELPRSRVGLEDGVPLEVDSPEARRWPARWPGGGQLHTGGMVVFKWRLAYKWLHDVDKWRQPSHKGSEYPCGREWSVLLGFVRVFLYRFPDLVVNLGPALFSGLHDSFPKK